MRSLGWALSRQAWCPYKDHVKTQGEDSHPQATERGLIRNKPLQHLDFGLPDSRTSRRHIFVV